MHQSKQVVAKAIENYVDTNEQDNTIDLNVDFDALRKENSDVIAWLYCEDSNINYPVVQGCDNEYYLSHLLDGSVNYNGTLFADYHYKPAFGIANTIIYSPDNCVPSSDAIVPA